MEKPFLANAFSMQMLHDFPATVTFEEISKNEIPSDVVSAVGHKDTAAVLGVECNRVNVALNKGDVLFIAQLQGGRLPEGTTTLPEGFSFKFFKVTVK